MVTALQELLGDRIKTGVAVVPHGIQEDLAKYQREDLLPKPGSSISILEGAKLNIPDEDSVAASQKILSLTQSLSNKDILLTLVSGGGSALLSLPVPPLTLNSLQHVTRSLSRAGADITEINTVRKHLEVLKGGGLAHLTQPAQVVSLILSDVIDDPIELIASGPTAKSTSTSQDALRVISKYLPPNQVPQEVMSLLQSNGKEQYIASIMSAPPEAGMGSVAHNIIVGSNSIALESARDCCRSEGVLPFILTAGLQGNAAKVGRDLATLASRILRYLNGNNFELQTSNLLEPYLSENRDIVNDSLLTLVCEARVRKKPICLLAGGETIVYVTGSGKGGRNQEMCLAAAQELRQLDECPDHITISSVGTDGQDGPTDAAGAAVTSATTLPYDPSSYLTNNDSYGYFSEYAPHCLIKTGLTGTNVMDITMVLINPPY